jgi:transposase
MHFVKQVVGIDISKSELVCKAGRIGVDQTVEVLSTGTFSNDFEGFEELMIWSKEVFSSVELPLCFVMEATGVYYECLAYYLVGLDLDVSVLLPNKVKHFGKTLEIKSKTDALDAEVILRIGLERKLTLWQPGSNQMRSITVLTREQAGIKAKRTVVKNQLHARSHAYGTPTSTIKRMNEQIALLDKQLAAIELELRQIVAQDQVLSEKIARLETIPGIGFNTLITLIGETNGFALIRNAKQLVSYAGLDVVHRESGNWKGKSMISKKGNKFIRAALYMPALACIRYNEPLKKFHQSLCERKPAKKIGVIAVARKLLSWVYILWKNGTEFDAERAMVST